MTGAKHGTKEFGADWRQTAGTFEPKAEYRSKSGLMLNTATALPGIICCDSDIDGEAAAVGCRIAIESVLPACQFVRTRLGSHRIALLYRCEETAACYTGLQGSEGGIELLTGSGCKLTTFGLHTDKGLAR